MSGSLEKGVAHLPGGLLQALAQPGRFPGHVAAAGDEPHPGQFFPRTFRGVEPLGGTAQPDKFFHKFGVLCGFRTPQAVVVVGGHQGEVQLPPQAVEPMKQVY